MPWSPDFYRRRFEDQLSARHDDGMRPPLPWPQTEADLLAVADDAEFVQQAFRYYLKREPDLGGLMSFCDVAEKFGRQTVVDGIRNSEEGRRLAPLPAAAEVEEAPGPPAPDPAPPVSDTPELADLVGITDDDAFVAAAYRRALGRPPDADGFEHFAGRLRQGESRKTVIQSLTSSPEARELGRPYTWNGRPWPEPSVGARIRELLRRALGRSRA